MIFRPIWSARAFLYASLTLFVAAILPVLKPFGVSTPTNPIYGFIYGLGWIFWELVLPRGFPGVQAFGGIIWPLGVLFVVYFLYIAGSESSPGRKVWLALLWLAVVVVVPRAWLHWTSNLFLPTYEETLETFY